MFTAIRIKGLGPYTDYEQVLDPRGSNTVAGPSQSGKSTLLEAVCFALWGTDSRGKPFPADAIHDGSKRAEVELVTARSTIRRTMTRKRSQTRTITSDDGPREYTSEAAFQAAIKGLGRQVGKVHVGRLLAVPMAWVELAEGAGGGRPLRNALAAILPGEDADEVARLMAEAGQKSREGDPTTTNAAMDDRRQARRRLDHASGSLESARETLASLEHQEGVETVTPEQVVEAQDTLRAVAAWDEYLAERQDHQEQEAHIADWDRRAAELGERPEVDVGALARARDDVHAAQSRLEVAQRAESAALVALRAAEAASSPQEPAYVDEACQAAGRAERKADEARAALEQAKDGRCPTCGSDGYIDTEALLAEVMRAEQAHEQAETAWQEARDRGREEMDQARAQAEAAVIDARDTHQQAEARVQEARDRVLKRERVMDALTDQQADQRAWDRAQQALGERPESAPTPERPEVDRPEEGAQTVARTRMDIARTQDALRERAAQQLQEARGRVSAAETAIASAQADVDHYEALVDALRRAPSERLRRGLDALGDLGPVTIEVPEDSDGVHVLVDGRSWGRASTGRQIVADLHLRLALRRALRWGWWPVWVDRVQDWSGDFPEAAPAVYLRTVEAEQAEAVAA